MELVYGIQYLVLCIYEELIFILYTTYCILLKQFLLQVCWHCNANVFIAVFGKYPSSRSALDKSTLKEVGFVEFFDGCLLFRKGSGNRVEADRTSAEFICDDLENFSVRFRKSFFIYS